MIRRLLVAVLAAAVTSTAAALPATADAASMAMCVLSSTRYTSAVKAAVAELDTVPEVDARYRSVVHGCHDTAVEVIVVEARKGPDAAIASTYRDGDRWLVVFNTDHRGYPRGMPRMVALHELGHVVIGHPHAHGWGDNGHTSRCDSVMSRDPECILALDGLTAYDRAWIARGVTAATSSTSR